MRTTEVTMAERSFAVVGLFESAQALMDGIPTVRERKLGRLEAYTPYPIHGIDPALGFRKTPLAGMVFIMGLLGTATALFFQWWMSTVDYPIPVGGKNLFSWQAFIPVMFEVTVLFATFTAGLGMLFILNKLPFWGHPILHSPIIARITKDAFALSIEAGRSAVDEDAARAALLEAGATHVEVVPFPAPAARWSLDFVWRTFFGIGVACLVAGIAMYWVIKLFPTLPPIYYMDDQNRYDAYATSSFFADGRSMQMPVPGTVARGHLPYTVATDDEAARLVNPLAPSGEVLRSGKRAWMDHCSVCHGAVGDGVGSLTAAYGAKPANLHAQTFRAEVYPDGRLYHTIMKGKNAMPSYAADLTEQERWAVVHYVRALQRAQNAREEDVR
jgi:mono/diheme cytochrome c family protein